MVDPRWTEFWKSAGGCLDVRDGHEVFTEFGDPIQEVLTVRRSAGMMDLSYRESILLRGGDRVRFLHGQVTNQIKGLEAGQGVYAAMINAKGKMIGDLVVLVQKEFLRLTLPSLPAAPVLEHLNKYIIMDDVTAEIVDPSNRVLLLVGPEAPRFLRAATGCDIPTLSPYDACLIGDTGAHFELTGYPDVGEVGFEIRGSTADLLSLAAKLRISGVRPIGFKACETLRVEAGTPRFGADMDSETLPPEARLDHAISYTKGCYVGQEVMARLKAYGEVSWILSGVRLSEPLPAGSRLLSSTGLEAGRVSSVVFSPHLESLIGLAILRRSLAKCGEVLTSADGSPTCRVVVMDLPFVPFRNRPLRPDERFQTR